LRELRNGYLEGDAYNCTAEFVEGLIEARVRVWSAYQRTTRVLDVADFDGTFECPVCIGDCTHGWMCPRCRVCSCSISRWTNTAIAYHVPNNDPDEEQYYFQTQQPHDTCPQCRALIW
jgi:rubrerythrin